jgi:hypothetical protein
VPEIALPENADLCPTCVGTALNVAQSRLLGPRFVACRECSGTGVVVDWPAVDDEIAELLGRKP